MSWGSSGRRFKSCQPDQTVGRTHRPLTGGLIPGASLGEGIELDVAGEVQLGVEMLEILVV